MQNYLYHLKLTGKKILVILLLFTLSRLFFYILNAHYFDNVGKLEFIKLMFIGVRFDLSLFSWINFLFVLLYLIPFSLRDHKLYQNTIDLAMYLINSILLGTNFMDAKYFDFTNKRTTADIFSFVEQNKAEVKTLIPQFLLDYWYVVALWIVSIVLGWILFPKFKVGKAPSYLYNKRQNFFEYAGFVVVFGLLFLAARGTGLKPLTTSDAARFTNVQNTPIVLNTPFVVLKTFDKPYLKELHYFNEKELKANYSPIRNYSKGGEFRKMNVVIFIMESFSKEYIGYFNHGKGYTPFLDSLASQSLIIEHAFANGKRSIEAMPAIIASVPSLMEEPYLSSSYSTNLIQSLPNLLKNKGYYTSFFHGGTNGTMGFDNFAGIAGYDKYFGRNEYGNEKDFDGNWGIFDEPFLQFFANKMNSFKQPFFTTDFTLSSHHPYTIPAAHKNQFKAGTLPIHISISYADYSLKRFFQTASKMPWYKNTLFIITADHTAQAEKEYYQNRTGRYMIPIIYFCPSDPSLKGMKDIVSQQIDIMPSVLDYLHFPDSFFSFGSSCFNKDELHFALNLPDAHLQYIIGNYALNTDIEHISTVYDFVNDSLQKINLIHDKKSFLVQWDKQTKAFMQTYSFCLINNRMRVENFK
jgi:phosphoglycerol transferase MdoB-like AlkP superfamily enzyme